VIRRRSANSYGSQVRLGHLELAVLALVEHVEQVAAFAIAYDLAVPHGPAFRIVTGFPAVQRLAVEHDDPSAIVIRCQQTRPEPQTSRRQPHWEFHPWAFYYNAPAILTLMYLKILAHLVFVNLNFHMPMIVDLSYPLVLLQGENGSGKSALLRAARPAVDGYIYRLQACPLPCRAAPERAPSSTPRNPQPD
jgi:hypothetical protein